MKKKILFVGHDLKFVKDLINYFDNHKNFEVKVDQWAGHNLHDEEKSFECLKWADIIFCEWGLGNAVWYSKNKLSHQKLIVRMHRQELETNYPKLINIDHVDLIIVISPYLYEDLYKTFKLNRNKMKVIYNFVNEEIFHQPKLENVSFNLGMIGISPKLKRLDLALDLFEKLWNTDKRYNLYIKGKLPQEYPWIWRNKEQREYYEEQFNRIEKSKWKKNVHFDGFGQDVGNWIRKIGFILSMSDFESFHLAIAESMISGTVPIIRNWEGAEIIYGSKFIINNLDEAYEKILNVNHLDKKSFEILVDEIKQYSLQNFSLKNIVKHYEKIFNEI